MLPVLGSAAAGFYRVNRPPARVFMGDAGSHLLGFLLAIQVFLGDGEYYIARPVIPLFGPTLSAGAIWICYLPFIFDVTITLLRRARLGENLISPHRSHLYQRLMITGMSHREVLLLNIRYFRICGALGLTFAVLPWLTRELLRVSFPSVVGRVVLGGAAFLVMVYYWLTVLKKERAGGRAAPAGAK
ncbi:hypothetical protein HY256_10280 [Candidatus Sumerlaeota bacterium]|nr:hypothetical protein [Candidatus Sumerlaeota bacterium]